MQLSLDLELNLWHLPGCNNMVLSMSQSNLILVETENIKSKSFYYLVEVV